MPKICGRKATSLTSFLFLYTICLIAIVPRLAVAEKNIIMKQNYLKELMTALLLLCCTVAGAADFEVDGICYNILSDSDKTVEVTSDGYNNHGAVTIPASITYNSITYSVTSIGDYAFSYCWGLISIEIPSSVTSIDAWAFSGCTSLTSVVSCIAAEDLFAINTVAFSGIDNEACTLYVPAGAKSTYAATDGWKEFTNIVETSTAEYSLTVSSAGYATMYLDKAVEIPAGAKAYTANRIEGDYLKMQPVEGVIPANTAVIIKAGEGTYSFAYSDETPEAISDNLLRGTVADTYVKPQSGSVAYVLSMVDGVVGMYRAKLTDGTFKNNANRAYMLLSELKVGDDNIDTSAPGSQLSNGYRFDFSGTTAIESVETESTAPAVYYDLSGRRVENPAKGIYIVNGKKVYIK